MFWNVENFFDWRNDSTTVSDAEFSAQGERHWTWKRFQTKANAFAKALLWVEGETGQLPDIVGLAEVENAFVLRQVLQKTALRKLDYKYVHYDSPDRRGIDVALLYRSSRLELIDSKPCHLFAADTLLATRDILLCRFRLRSPVRERPGPSEALSSGPPVIPYHPFSVIPNPESPVVPVSRSPVVPDTESPVIPDPIPSVIPDPIGNLEFAVLVNHHPSKYGGAGGSEPRRRIAVERLRFLADSLHAVGIDRIIAVGDFNDTPDNPLFRLLEPALLPLYGDLHRRGEGTIKYEGKWDLIDQFYVSPAFLRRPEVPVEQQSIPSVPPESHNGRPSTVPMERHRRKPSTPSARMRILRIPFLLTRDTVHAGEKPLRTYTGPRYTGGVSDHLPILLEVALPP